MSESARQAKMTEHALRLLLLTNEDGMTVNQLAKTIGRSHSHVNAVLSNTYGFYVDRWTEAASTYASVWCVIKVPENCPRPDWARQ